MKRTRLIGAALVTAGLTAMMHLDWHAARPVVHHLSLGWQWHWLIAAPAFALTAWYVWRAWPDHLLGVSLAMVGTASILAAVIEPAWEYWVDGATLEWTFGRVRLTAFAAFLATGAVTYAAVLSVVRRSRRAAQPPVPSP